MFRPSQTSDKSRDCASIHVEFEGKIGVRAASLTSPDYFADVTVCEFANAGHSQASVDGVVMVTKPRYPFEVSPDVVRLDGIDVVYLGEVVRIWDERQSYEPMHSDVSIGGGVSEVHGRIPTRIGFGGQFLANKVSGPFDADPAASHGMIGAIQASHPPIIADFVKVGELGDGDAPPLFVIHSLGLPSGGMSASSNMATSAKSR